MENVFNVDENAAGKRLDRFLAAELADYSRSRIQSWIRGGRVLVDDVTARPSLKLHGGEVIEVDPAPLKPLRAEPEDIPLDILYEDDDLVAVNKPSGMTVHAGAGEHARGGTLVNALLHRFQSLSSLGGELRPGIVHRLDRMTSGVILVAKTDRAHRRLAELFEQREIRKTYLAIVHGRMDDPNDAVPRKARIVRYEGATRIRVEAPIGRDPKRRNRMAAVQSGRTAVSDFRPLAATKSNSLVEARIHTGRTHQIRVHLAWIGRPVVGDVLYGAPADPPRERFFLHAWKLGLEHPVTGEPLTLVADPPPDFQQLRKELGLDG